MKLDNRRYPVGNYTPPVSVTQEDIESWISIIEAFPANLKVLVEPLEDVQLMSRYRDGGWTIRQIIHHVVDSHLNSYVRFKWVLTEDNPTIKTYNQELWAERPDAKDGPIDMSLEFLTGLHKRWTYVLRTIDEQEWNRTFFHPEFNKTYDLKWLLGLYAWHCRHHLAHVELALQV